MDEVVVGGGYGVDLGEEVVRLDLYDVFCDGGVFVLGVFVVEIVVYVWDVFVDGYVEGVGCFLELDRG